MVFYFNRIQAVHVFFLSSFDVVTISVYICSPTMVSSQRPRNDDVLYLRILSTQIFGLRTVATSRFSTQKKWLRKHFWILLVPMGLLASWSAHARPSAQTPIDTSVNFRHKCLITPSVRKVTAAEERREKNAVNSGHLAPSNICSD